MAEHANKPPMDMIRMAGRFGKRRVSLISLMLMALCLVAAAGATAATDWRDLSRRWQETGSKQAQAGNYAGARISLERAITADPKNALALAWLGTASQKLGDSEAAQKYFRIAMEVDPDHRGVLLLAGKADAEAGAADKAKEKLARLQRICDGDCPEARDLNQFITARPGK